MIDGITIDIESIERERYLSEEVKLDKYWAKTEIEKESGDLQVGRYNTLNGMEIRLTSKRKILKGSIHKYFNKTQSGVAQNYDLFTYDKFEQAVEALTRNFGDEIKGCPLKKLELGVNIKLSMPVEEFIVKYFYTYDKDHILSHEYDKIPEKTGFYNTIKLSKQKFKVYDKSKMYQKELQEIGREEDQILRVEFVDENLTIVNKQGINTLADLLDKQKYINLQAWVRDKKFKNFLLRSPLSYEEFKRLDHDDERRLAYNLQDKEYFKKLRRRTNKNQNNFDKGYYEAIDFFKGKGMLKINDQFHKKVEENLNSMITFDRTDFSFPNPTPIFHSNDIIDFSGIENLTLADIEEE